MPAIYSYTPSENGDIATLIETFDTHEDAKHVLAALEEVNINFNLYRIVEKICNCSCHTSAAREWCDKCCNN